VEGGTRNRADLHLAGCLPYLWRTVKYEEVYIHDYLPPCEARQALTRNFAFYNHERPHQALENQTPAEVYFQPVPAGQRQHD
jgi:transposase InsO family protein